MTECSRKLKSACLVTFNQHLILIFSYKDLCQSGSCDNGGTCVAAVGVASCVCVAGYTGEACESIIGICLFCPCSTEFYMLNEEQSFNYKWKTFLQLKNFVLNVLKEQKPVMDICKLHNSKIFLNWLLRFNHGLIKIRG